MLARVKGVEVGIAVHAADDGLAIDNELLLAVLQRGLDNPGVALGPVIAALGDQPDAISVALEPQAIAVEFQLLVKNLGKKWQFLRSIHAS